MKSIDQEHRFDDWQVIPHIEFSKWFRRFLQQILAPDCNCKSTHNYLLLFFFFFFIERIEVGDHKIKINELRKME